MQQGRVVSSLNELAWSQQVRVQQSGVNRERKHEHEREDDEREARPDSLT
jgi:hypothetical protein